MNLKVQPEAPTASPAPREQSISVTTRAGFEAFRDRMCNHFAQMPDGLGKKPLHVEQADLDPDTFSTVMVTGKRP